MKRKGKKKQVDGRQVRSQREALGRKGYKVTMGFDPGNLAARPARRCQLNKKQRNLSQHQLREGRMIWRGKQGHENRVAYSLPEKADLRVRANTYMLAGVLTNANAFGWNG
eukprot:1161364-Pelagomonas_calceolata.AAC.15